MNYFDELVDKQDALFEHKSKPTDLKEFSERRRSVFTTESIEKVDNNSKSFIYLLLYFHFAGRGSISRSRLSLHSAPESAPEIDTLVLVEQTDTFSPITTNLATIEAEKALRLEVDRLTAIRNQSKLGEELRIPQQELLYKAVEKTKLLNAKQAEVYNEELNRQIDINSSRDAEFDIVIADLFSELAPCASLDESLINNDIFNPRIRIRLAVRSVEVKILSEETEIEEERKYQQSRVMAQKIISLAEDQHYAVVSKPAEDKTLWVIVLMEHVLLNDDVQMLGTLCVLDPIIDDYVFENDDIAAEYLKRNKNNTGMSEESDPAIQMNLKDITSMESEHKVQVIAAEKSRACVFDLEQKMSSIQASRKSLQSNIAECQNSSKHMPEHGGSFLVFSNFNF